MNILSALNWRYATKAFDPTKKISEADLDEILESMRLTASSFGLQPWKFILVENPTIREEIKAEAWGQAQVTEASHLLVLAAKTDISEEYIQNFLQATADASGIPVENLEGYKGMITGTVQSRSSEEILNWNAKQAYIVLGNLLTVCALKEIDSCPMEGFDKGAIDRILGLTEMGLASVVLCPIGYRSTSDHTAARPKVRFTKDEVTLRI